MSNAVRTTEGTSGAGHADAPVVGLAGVQMDEDPIHAPLDAVVRGRSRRRSTPSRPATRTCCGAVAVRA
jgi:hypothetical protein